MARMFFALLGASIILSRALDLSDWVRLPLIAIGVAFATSMTFKLSKRATAFELLQGLVCGSMAADSIASKDYVGFILFNILLLLFALLPPKKSHENPRT